MKYRLMNSAMMPAPGRYAFRRVPLKTFVAAVQCAHHDRSLISYCGYPQNARLLSDLAEVPIEVSRRHAGPDMENGDVLLIMTLRYRTDGGPKGGRVSEDDFEFGIATFSSVASPQLGGWDGEFCPIVPVVWCPSERIRASNVQRVLPS